MLLGRIGYDGLLYTFAGFTGLAFILAWLKLEIYIDQKTCKEKIQLAPLKEGID